MVAPIHHFLVVRQYVFPIDACDELSHVTSDSFSDPGVAAYEGSVALSSTPDGL